MTTMQAIYETEVDADTVVIDFREISRFSREELGPQLQEELEREEFAHCKNILVDCQHLKYANSLFVEVLLRMSRLAADRNGQFAVCCLGDFLQQVIVVTRLDNRWPTYNSREQALEELNRDL